MFIVIDLLDIVNRCHGHFLALEDLHVFLERLVRNPRSHNRINFVTMSDAVLVSFVARVTVHIVSTDHSKDAFSHRLHRARHRQPLVVFGLVNVAGRRGC